MRASIVVTTIVLLTTAPTARADHVVPPQPTTILDPTDQDLAAFGNAIGVGDFNGDGLEDMVVGADQWSGNVYREGRIYVFLRTPDGWTRVGRRISHPTDQEWSLFGFSIAAGDVDGDGFDDVVVGAPEWSDGSFANHAGRVYVYRGGPDGVLPTPWSVTGTGSADRLGWSVASGADVNGDGFDDVAVGCLNCDGSVDGEGSVHVYLGSADGLLAEPVVVLEPTDDFSSAFGGSVSLGDVNADGYADVIAGAYAFDTAGWGSEGRAYTFHGSELGPDTVPEWRADPADQAHANFGRVVSAVGDVDGDGFDDVAIAAPRWEEGSVMRGRVWIYRGSESGLADPWRSVRGPKLQSSGFGYGLAGGDVDQDGFDDLLVGAVHWGRQLWGEGRVFIYRGTTAGIPRLWDFPGSPTNQTDSYFGHAVAVFASGGMVGGAFYADDEAVNEGAVYLYERSTAGS